ncbi:MAG: integrase [SAR86 cluster bacterium]|uniref:Integrase n=1 Tax=SAR86 cluster bacterium TaxID=2030880 RepID=A0A2A5ATD9_9GAMM|nr:MAG: integrase [SAR86 cluster bacterium]
MAIRKEGNRWLVDLRMNGLQKIVGQKRIRKKFPTKPEAIRYQVFIQNKLNQDKPWNPINTDRRSLTDLIDRWYKAHGSTLVDGKRRKKSLLALAELMGDPLASEVSAKMYVDSRHHRLTIDKVSANTVNHELAYLKAVFNELDRLDEWQHDNPLGKVRRLQLVDNELTWLNESQVKDLLQELKNSSNEHVYYVARICLNTGARWGEAEALTSSQIRGGKIRLQSKNGLPRSVPYLDAELDTWLDDAKRQGVLFSGCAGAFRKAIERANIVLPPGQLTHVCRHTFASNHMASGGDIITLKEVLGHTSLAMTVRYAHLAPDHLADVPGRTILNRLKL